ncbi:hypothetical protein AB7X32_15115 [Morganella morganii]|uniref:hypothetical protein n=1 Tax=Morganella morganii TaxID=582 RepID=UPI0034E5C589
MSANITIHQAANKAQQIEMINLLIESYPHKIESNQITALSSLMAKLSSDVYVFLIEEIAAQEATK